MSVPLYRDFGANVIHGCTFSNNTAKDRGGAVAIEARYAGSGMPVFSVTDSRFSSNVAKDGGAVHVGNTFAGAFIMHGIAAYSNVASIGGGIQVKQLKEPKPSLDAAGRGGFVAYDAPRTRSNAFILRHSQVFNNSAIRGGAIYGGPGANVFFSGAVLSGNTAYDGGVVYCNNCDVLATGMDTDPSIEVKGLPAGIVLSGVPKSDDKLPKGMSEIVDTVVADPKLTAVTLMFDNNALLMPFEPNDSGRGGAVHCFNCGVMVLTHVIISYNQAALGGGVYAAGNDYEHGLVAVVSIATLEDNQAVGGTVGKGEGGALYV